MIMVSTLPADLRTTLGGRDVILFDGECVLCSGFFRFVLARDTGQRFSFIRAQSGLGTQLYRALDLDPVEFETNLVIVDGRIWQNLDAFAAAMAALGGVWSALSWLRMLPDMIKRPLYRLVARNRYRLFGRQDSCMMPDPSVANRFLDISEGALT